MDKVGFVALALIPFLLMPLGSAQFQVSPGKVFVSVHPGGEVDFTLNITNKINSTLYVYVVPYYYTAPLIVSTGYWFKPIVIEKIETFSLNCKLLAPPFTLRGNQTVKLMFFSLTWKDGRLLLSYPAQVAVNVLVAG